MAAPNLKNPTTITGKTAGYAVPSGLTATLVNASGSSAVLKVNSVYCANVDGSTAADVTLEHFNSVTGSGFKIANTIVVPADATQVLVTREAYIYLEEGYSLRAQASVAGDLELVIGYEEIS